MRRPEPKEETMKRAPTGRSGWTVGLLSTFRLERDGDVVLRLLGRQQDRLLAFLALHRNQDVGREQLGTLLWPEKPHHRQRSRLSETLFHLRAELAEHGAADDFVLANRYTLALNPEVTTDIEHFEALVGAARAAADPAARLALLEEATALHGAGLLPALTDDWLEPERRRLTALAEEAGRALTALRERAPELGAAALGTEGGAARAAPRPVEAVPQRATPVAAGSDDGESLPRAGRASLPGDIRRRLALRHLALAEEAEAGLWGPEREAWLDRLEAAHTTLSTVLEWAIEDEDDELALRMAGALWPFWLALGHLDEGRRLIERALFLRPNSRAAIDANALNGAGALAMQAGELELAGKRLDLAQEIWREIGDDVGLARTLNNQAIRAVKAGRYA
jgi:hypothetical protein